MRALSSKTVPVNIKLQVEDLPPQFSDKLVSQFKSTDTLWSVFKYFETKSGINFTTRTQAVKTSESSGRLFFETPAIKSFNCNASTLKDFAKTLMDLGLTSKQENLRVRFERTDIPIEEALLIQEELFREEKTAEEPVNAVQDSTAQASTEQESLPPTESAAVPEDIKTSTLEATSPIRPRESVPDVPAVTTSSQPTNEADRAVKVYLPSSGQRKFDDADDATYRVSVNHSQAYQAQILKTAKIGDGPLLTKQLRQNLEDEKLKKIQDIQIRIRFPDLTHLQASFKPNETIGHVLGLIESAIAYPNLPFKIFSSPPKTYYTDPSLVLVRQCKFGARNLVSFEWDHGAGVPKSAFPTSGILKPEYLSGGTSITNSPDIALDKLNSQALAESQGPSAAPKKKSSLTQSQKERLLKFVKTGKK